MNLYRPSLVLAAALITAGAALADRAVTVTTSSAVIERVAAVKQQDGSWKATVCGSALTDGGLPAPLASPCVQCEAPTWGGLTAACMSAFRSANTD